MSEGQVSQHQAELKLLAGHIRRHRFKWSTEGSSESRAVTCDARGVRELGRFKNVVLAGGVQLYSDNAQPVCVDHKLGRAKIDDVACAEILVDEARTLCNG